MKATYIRGPVLISVDTTGNFDFSLDVNIAADVQKFDVQSIDYNGIRKSLLRAAESLACELHDHVKFKP